MNIMLLSNCLPSLAKEIVFKVNSHDNFILTKFLNFHNELESNVQNEANEKTILFYYINNNDYCHIELEKVVHLAKNKNIQVLVLCDNYNETIITSSLNNGFIGCLELNFFLNNAQFVLQSLHEYNSFYTSPMTVNLYFNAVSSEIDIVSNLTKQQLKIALNLKEGKSYNEISLALGISINTVRMHVRMLYKKLNIKNKMQLIVVLSKSKI